MHDERFPTKVWIQAGLALCSGRGIPAMVLYKGDPDTGTVIVKITALDGMMRLLTRQRDLEGVLHWTDVSPEEPFPSEESADSYIERARHRDPDLWVIEIEDRHMRNPFCPSEWQ